MKKSVCPIGIECSDRPCNNYRQCKDLTISWEIPYTRTREALIVKQYGWRRDWRDESEYFGQPIGWCSINTETDECGYYKSVYDSDEAGHNDEMNERLCAEWRLAGWHSAVSITTKPQEIVETAKPQEIAEVEEIPF